jgi:hypothetical protein
VASRPVTILMWPLGVAFTSWSYIWRTTIMHRRELDGVREEDMPPGLPDGVSREGIQLPEHGSGPLFHRTYTGAYRDAGMSPEELIEWIGADPNRVAPVAFARFRKQRGEDGQLVVGDEFEIEMPGPWNGPVRCIDRTPTSFRFATLEGHLEAGEIEWRAFMRDGLLAFQIDSRARAGDRLSAILHDRLLMAKEVQLHMWISVVERVARELGGRLAGGVDVHTRRVDGSDFS